MNLKRAVFRVIHLSHSDVWQVHRGDSVWFMLGLGELPQISRFFLGKINQDPITYSQSQKLQPLVIALLVMLLHLLDGDDSPLINISTSSSR